MPTVTINQTGSYYIDGNGLSVNGKKIESGTHQFEKGDIVQSEPDAELHQNIHVTLKERS